MTEARVYCSEMASGATVLEATESKDDSGILGFALHSDEVGLRTSAWPLIAIFKELNNDDRNVVDQGEYGKMQMNGAEVYKFAVSEVPEVIKEGLANAGLGGLDVDWLYPSVNIRIKEHAADVLGIPMKKVLRNIQEYGNTSAGSIPLALAEAVRAGKVKKGDIIACAGFGAGLSWASVVIRWGRDHRRVGTNL